MISRVVSLIGVFATLALAQWQDPIRIGIDTTSKVGVDSPINPWWDNIINDPYTNVAPLKLSQINSLDLKKNSGRMFFCRDCTVTTVVIVTPSALIDVGDRSRIVQ